MSDPSPSNSFALTDAEIGRLSDAANRGDVAAMNKLALHYGIHLQDVPNQLIWLERAAELGDADARKFVLAYYSTHTSPQEREKGVVLRKKWFGDQ